MRKARHIDISTRLEATKRLGLVEDYQIDWRSKSLCAPRVTICARAQTPRQVTKNYVSILLEQLVPTREIVVTRRMKIS
ncbi:MAG: hypothetical protein EKK40_04355 [Bradyrhizobiaceae bacterium]|nr:MAG: hypothetical protein EKK40_04355 [Bradyrhizobiaceae bacterium]